MAAGLHRRNRPHDRPLDALDFSARTASNKKERGDATKHVQSATRCAQVKHARIAPRHFFIGSMCQMFLAYSITALSDEK